MPRIQVTSREFRENQKSYFDLVDSGKEVIIKRKNKSYLLLPITEDDFKLSAEFLKRIERSKEKIKSTISIDTATDIIGTLKSLKMQDKIDIPEGLDVLNEEEDLLYKILGTEQEQDAAYNRVENYYAPLLKEYYEIFKPH